MDHSEDSDLDRDGHSFKDVVSSSEVESDSDNDGDHDDTSDEDKSSDQTVHLLVLSLTKRKLAWLSCRMFQDIVSPAKLLKI